MALIEKMTQLTWNALVTVQNEIDKNIPDEPIKKLIIVFVGLSLKEELKGPVYEKPALILSHVILKAYMNAYNSSINDTIKILAKTALLDGSLIQTIETTNVENIFEVVRLQKILEPEIQ